MMRILFVLLFTIGTSFAQDRTPAEVVKYALTALTNGDVEKLITVTENAELRQAKELLATIGGSEWRKNEVLKQYKNLKSWAVLETTNHDINGRKIAIVSTEWVVFIPIEDNPNIKKQEPIDRKVYVDYMLEQFDGQWKIISRRSLN